MQLEDYKIKIPNPEISRKVQEKAFSLGYKWKSGASKIPSYLNYKALYLYKMNLNISHTETTGTYFREHRNKEISWEDFLKLPIKLPANFKIDITNISNDYQKKVN